jgi:hypothetical protein
MWIMNLVWPITALYFGVAAILFYFWMGRKRARDLPEDSAKYQKPFWQMAFTGTTHCGGGCTIGDIIGHWAVFLFSWKIADSVLLADYVVDFTLAYLLGIVFQYFAIVPMRKLRPLPGIVAALKADTLSLIAFEVGLFAWMALTRYVLLGPLHPTEPRMWLTMQIGMILGFVTSYPVNWLLIAKGIKEKM